MEGASGKDMNKEYPYQERPAVQAAWVDGKHPDGCKGVCRVWFAGGIEACSGCGWDEVNGRTENNEKTEQ